MAGLVSFGYDTVQKETATCFNKWGSQSQRHERAPSLHHGPVVRSEPIYGKQRVEGIISMYFWADTLSPMSMVSHEGFTWLRVLRRYRRMLGLIFVVSLVSGFLGVCLTRFLLLLTMYELLSEGVTSMYTKKAIFLPSQPHTTCSHLQTPLHTLKLRNLSYISRQFPQVKTMTLGTPLAQ